MCSTHRRGNRHLGRQSGSSRSSRASSMRRLRVRTGCTRSSTTATVARRERSIAPCLAILFREGPRTTGGEYVPPGFPERPLLGHNSRRPIRALRLGCTRQKLKRPLRSMRRAKSAVFKKHRHGCRGDRANGNYGQQCGTRYDKQAKHVPPFARPCRPLRSLQDLESPAAVPADLTDALRSWPAREPENGADGGTRTRIPFREADFRTTSAFAAASWAFVVWTIPSPWPSDRRRHPSSLYTFPGGAWLGIGLGRTLSFPRL